MIDKVLVSSLQQAFPHRTQPSRYSVVLATAADLTRRRSELIAENALLRQQLIILHRQVKKPAFTHSDRLWLVLLASRVKNCKEHLLILRPDTLLHWHRQGFRLFWKFKSRNRRGRPKLSTDTVALIQQMAQENRLWGAERIRGELLKLGLAVAKHTIQKYITWVRPAKPTSQTWAIFLRNHAEDIWACDFLLSSTSGFGRSISFSLSSWLRGGLCISGSRNHQRTRGSPNNCAKRRPSVKRRAF